MKPGTRKLSEVAKKLVVPSGIVSTGWPAVRDLCVNRLGIGFDGWQDGAGRLILAERADGKLAAMIDGVGMSLPRQVGKTYLIGAIIFALCILRRGLLVIWSAHHAKTHGETFLSMQAFAKRAKVAPYILQVFTGSGDEEVRFRNGSRILFGARERGFGRGIPGVDVIVSDEAQIMSDKALDAQLATMNVSRFGLAVYIGTPPRPDDQSEAFTRMRADAWAGRLTDGVWIELGAASGANPDDRKQWAVANPSYPHRTPAESILRLRRKLKPESFLREGLGIWDSDGAGGVFGPSWAACKGVLDAPLGWLGVAASLDLTSAAIVGAGRSGGRVLVKPLAYGQGLLWVESEFDRWPALRVMVDPKGPAGVLVPALRTKLGKRLYEAKPVDVLDACAEIDRSVASATLVHGDHQGLNDAVRVAVKRPVGDRWAWGRRRSEGDISLLESASWAAWAIDGVRVKAAPPPEIF